MTTLLAVVVLGLSAPSAATASGVGPGFLFELFDLLDDLFDRPHGRTVAPDELGPWAVGRMTFEVVDPERSDRSLMVDVWYPVDEVDAVGPASVYDLLFTGLESAVALDAPPVSSEGPFPLVAFSHGNNGIRFQSFFLTEHLASHGFVVVAPDHSGNTALDLISPGTPFEARDRPLDIQLVITRILERNASAGDAFEGRVDPERIGVAGHSFGGFTTLAIGAGFDDVPPDDRVDALMPVSPVSTSFSDDELASIDLPTLVLGGTADVTTPLDPQSVLAFEGTSGLPRYRVDVHDAGHNSFTEICAFTDALIDVGLPPDLLGFLLGNADEGCGPELIDLAEAHRITNRYATAFMRVHVEGDFRYARHLTRAASRREPVTFFKVSLFGTRCGLGGELAVAVPVLLTLRRMRRRTAA
ncbi:MAG: alpha/beta hydrolase family protein [Myxococcota bacterium]